MPINTVCPECDSRFRLLDSMHGQSMRCPVCKQVFVARDVGEAPALQPVEAPPPPPAAARPRTDAPVTNFRSGNVADFVPLIVEPKRPTKAEPEKPRVVKWSDDIVPLQPRTGKTIIDLEPEAPQEMAWSPDAEPPAAFEAIPAYVAPAPPPVDARVAAKKRRGFKWVVAGSIALVALLITIGVVLKLNADFAPERLYTSAKENYDGQKFDQARRLFEQIVAEHPDHARVPEARFFSELSGVRHAVGSVMNRSDPQPAVTLWKKFLALIDEDPKIAPFSAKEKFGIDIWQGGSKLVEDVVAKANEVFDRDNPDEAEKWTAEAAAIESSLDRFRPADVGKSESVATALAGLTEKISTARQRLALLDTATDMLKDNPDDEKIWAAKKYAAEHGLDKDESFLARIVKAEREIESKAFFRRIDPPIQAVPFPDDGLTSLLFAPRLDKGDKRGVQAPWTVFYAVARGVLYALDEADGHVLWATRTGLDSDVMPVRVPGGDRHPDMALVASNDGTMFGITGRSARDGTPLWHQPLKAQCLGMPVVIGPNVYVATGDAQGTIVEIAIATGEITGEISTGRPLGPYMANRPGTGLLYVPADARAVYVWDADGRGPNGERLDPKFLGVMTTGHPAGTLRGIPAFSNPEPDSPGPKYLVLGQADSLQQMKLRAFSLPATADGKPDSAPAAKDLLLNGWSSFAPACDGEKLAVVTDRGEFGLFGLALAGNRDDALFPFPSRPGKAADRPARGQVVLAEEGAYWIIVRGDLRKLRFGINGEEGVRLVQQGDPIPVGEPLHPSQVNARGDTFVVVTQEGVTCRATAVDAATGLVRWRRDLGVTVKGDPLAVGNAVLLVDQAGGFYRVETTRLADRGGAAWLIDERWMIAAPSIGFTAATGLIPGPNGTAFMFLTGDSDKGPQLMIRRFDGTAVRDQLLPAPGMLAGPPTVSGQMVLLPLSNGTLYRLPLADGKILEEGPSWRSERQLSTATCYLAPIDDNEVIASDGGKAIVRWRWPAGSKLFESKGKLTLAERIAATPVVLVGEPPRVVIGDSKGTIFLVDADKLALPALAIWKPGAMNAIPIGAIGEGLRLEKIAGKSRMVYSVGGTLVAIDPDAESLPWVGPAPPKPVEGRAAFAGDRVWVTDRGGTVRVLDAATGKATGETYALTGSHAFAAAAVPLGGNRLLVPLADGTVVLGEVKKEPPMPKVEPKKIEPKKEDAKDKPKT